MQHLYTFYSDAFFIAVKSIIEHKLRAFLTLLGVIIGVASVVVVGASSSGLNSYVTEQVSKVLGGNCSSIFDGSDDFNIFRRSFRSYRRRWNCQNYNADSSNPSGIYRTLVNMFSFRCFGCSRFNLRCSARPKSC